MGLAHVAGAAAGAAAATVAMNRIFVLGYLILEPGEFLKLLEKMEKPVVLYMARREGILSKKETYTYIAKYGEFIILTKTKTPLILPSKVEQIPVREAILPLVVQSHLNSIVKEESSIGPRKR